MSAHEQISSAAVASATVSSAAVASATCASTTDLHVRFKKNDVLCGVSLGFERGTIQVNQTLASKRKRGLSTVPQTRGDLCR